MVDGWVLGSLRFNFNKSTSGGTSGLTADCFILVFGMNPILEKGNQPLDSVYIPIQNVAPSHEKIFCNLQEEKLNRKSDLIRNERQIQPARFRKNDRL